MYNFLTSYSWKEVTLKLPPVFKEPVASNLNEKDVSLRRIYNYSKLTLIRNN